MAGRAGIVGVAIIVEIMLLARGNAEKIELMAEAQAIRLKGEILAQYPEITQLGFQLAGRSRQRCELGDHAPGRHEENHDQSMMGRQLIQVELERHNSDRQKTGSGEGLTQPTAAYRMT